MAQLLISSTTKQALKAPIPKQNLALQTSKHPALIDSTTFSPNHFHDNIFNLAFH
jgi:hypothetical protein